MAKLEPSDFYLYRWRYFIGYGLITALLIAFLAFIGQHVPGALTQSEMNSVVHGATLNRADPVSFAVVNAPYYRLQQLSINAFGVTPFAIKLPSLAIAFLTAIGAVFLLRRWFKSYVAVLATMLLMTTGQFLFVAQNGTPAITLMFWSVWLLLTATMVTNKDSKHPIIWRAAFFILAGFSLYAPLNLYLLIAIISAALLHPHVRFVLKNMNRASLALFSLIGLIPLAPLAYLISLRPEFLFELLGKPETWPPDIIANIVTLFDRYFNFIAPPTGVFLTPVFGIGSLFLILLGIWQLARTHYNARSYTVATWILLLVPVILINPSYATVTFLPFLLVMASGFDYLIRMWYSIFPHNPYARMVGMIPLAVLVAGLVLSGIDRYVYGYHYSPAIVKNFSHDSVLLTNRLKMTDEPISVVVAKDELPFYQLLVKYITETDHKSIVIASDSHRYFDTTASVIVSKKAQASYSANIPEYIVTTTTTDDSDRFYVYKNTSK